MLYVMHFSICGESGLIVCDLKALKIPLDPLTTLQSVCLRDHDVPSTGFAVIYEDVTTARPLFLT